MVACFITNPKVGDSTSYPAELSTLSETSRKLCNSMLKECSAIPCMRFGHIERKEQKTVSITSTSQRPNALVL